jgi:hypothetical protein
VQGLRFVTGFYWDRDDETRAWSKRFFDLHRRMPAAGQAWPKCARYPSDSRTSKRHSWGFLALKLPIQLTVRRVYENDDVGLCVADWTIAGKAPDGKDVKLGGASAEVVRKTSGGNWVYVIDSPYGTAD